MLRKVIILAKKLSPQWKAINSIPWRQLQTKKIHLMSSSTVSDINLHNEQVEKSANDRMLYKVIKLDKNDLKCLLINDQEGDQSACSMHVAVGSLEDPIELQGLAHFCEHMLFLGTSKYPIESEYKAFLSQHGGTQNASTGPLSTVYHFSCANGEPYEQALDRFSQFFTAPLFTESCTKREMNAVDSENKKNFQNDSRRIYQIHRNSSRQGSVYNKFGTGNLQTLDKPNVREALIQFYTNNYSANRMTLVLYSNKSHEELQNYANKYFEGIPNHNLEQLVYKEIPFGEEQLAQYIKMVPVGESHVLQLQWQIDYMQPYYKSKPVEYITHLLGHEGENSLLSLLIDENLAFELSSGTNDSMRLYSEIYVDITLTPFGQNNLSRVFNIVGAYLKVIKETPVQQWVWDEIRDMKSLSFQFKEKSNPVQQAVLLSKKLYEYPAKDILSSSYIMQDYDEAKIQHFLNQLTVSNMRISNLSKSLAADCDMIEPIYETSFNISKISDQVRTWLEQPSLEFVQSSKKLGFPLKNIFIPKILKQVQGETEYLIEPKIIYEDDKSRVWLKQDNKFNTPKGDLELIIYWSNVNEQIKESARVVLSSLLLQMLKDKVRELNYLASQANLVDSRKSSEIYFKYNVSGFSDSIGVYTKQFATTLKEYIDSKPWEGSAEFIQKIKTFLQRKEISLKNYAKQAPYNQIDNSQNSLLDYERCSNEAQLEFIQNTNFEEILELYKIYHSKLLHHIRFEWSFIGNFEKTTSIDVAKAVQDIIFPQRQQQLIGLSNQQRILSKDGVQFGRTVQLNKQSTVIYARSLESEQSNSACQVIFQFSKPALDYRGDTADIALFKSHNTFKILHNFVKQPVFSQLRTQEQLGYIVTSSFKKINKIPHMAFLVQSSLKSPQFLSQRIHNCLKTLRDSLRNLSDEEFNKFVESVRTQYKRKHLTIYEEASYLNGIIEFHGKHFDLRQRYIDDLDTIKKEDIQELFDELFINEKRLLEIHLVASKHAQEQMELLEERKNSQETLIFSNSFAQTQAIHKIFPSFISFQL